MADFSGNGTGAAAVKPFYGFWDIPTCPACRLAHREWAVFVGTRSLELNCSGRRVLIEAAQLGDPIDRDPLKIARCHEEMAALRAVRDLAYNDG